MIDLARRSEPYEIALPYGLSVTVKPLTTAGMAAAQAAARRAVEAIERQVKERTEAGLPLEGLPALSAEGERDGFYQAQLIRELAVRHHHELVWRGAERRASAADVGEPRRGDGSLSGGRAVLPRVHVAPGRAGRTNDRRGSDGPPRIVGAPSGCRRVRPSTEGPKHACSHQLS